MKETETTRHIGTLGRRVIPIELRRNFDMNEKDAVEIFVDDNVIVLQKYSPTDIFSGSFDDLLRFHRTKDCIRVLEIAFILFTVLFFVFLQYI